MTTAEKSQANTAAATPPAAGAAVPANAPPAIQNPLGPFNGGAPGASNPLAPASQPLAANRRSFKLWGDPHAVAGDGKKFDNEQVGTITQLKSASGDFELQTTQQHPPGHPHVTVNTSAAIKSGNDLISYDVTRNALVINHQHVNLAPGASQTLSGGGKVERDAKGNLTITSAKGDVVHLNVGHTKDGQAPYLNLSGQLGASRTDGEVRGALGNFHNGDAANADFVGRDGKTYDAKYGSGSYKSLVSKNTYDKSAVEAFEKSWMVQGKGLLEQNQGQGTDAASWSKHARELELSQSQAHQAKSKLKLPGAPANGGNSQDKTYNIGGPQPAVRRQGHYIGVQIAKQFDAMVAAAKKDGVDLEIESGYRTYAEQEKLWNEFGHDPARVARPGTSNHEKGNAIDYKNTPGAWSWLKAHSTQFGFHNYPPEPWHYSLDGH